MSAAAVKNIATSRKTISRLAGLNTIIPGRVSAASEEEYSNRHPVSSQILITIS